MNYDSPDMERSEFCLDCVYSQEKINQLEVQVEQIQRMLTLLTLQVSAMKHDLFGEGRLLALDRNGNLVPEDR